MGGAGEKARSGGMNDELREYFILEPSGRVWWCAEGKGYTGDICLAGLFTKSEADRIVGLRRGDGAFHVLAKLSDLRRAREQHAAAVKSADRILATLVNVNQPQEIV